MQSKAVDRQLHQLFAALRTSTHPELLHCLFSEVKAKEITECINRLIELHLMANRKQDKSE